MLGKRGFYAYGFARVFWSFLIGLLIGLVFMYLYLKGLLPFKIPYL